MCSAISLVFPFTDGQMPEISTSARSVTQRALIPFLAALFLVRTFAAGQVTSPGTRPGFDGMWNSATATPLVRYTSPVPPSPIGAVTS